MTTDGALYVSHIVDGREVLKLAEMYDVKRWLYETMAWSGNRYTILSLNEVTQLRNIVEAINKDTAPFDIARTLTNG